MNKTLEKYSKLLEEGIDDFDMINALIEIKEIDNDTLSRDESLLKHILLECIKEIIYQ